MPFTVVIIIMKVRDGDGRSNAVRVPLLEKVLSRGWFEMISDPVRGEVSYRPTNRDRRSGAYFVAIALPRRVCPKARNCGLMLLSPSTQTTVTIESRQRHNAEQGGSYKHNILSCPSTLSVTRSRGSSTLPLVSLLDWQ